MHRGIAGDVKFRESAMYRWTRSSILYAFVAFRAAQLDGQLPSNARWPLSRVSEKDPTPPHSSLSQARDMGTLPSYAPDLARPSGKCPTKPPPP